MAKLGRIICHSFSVDAFLHKEQKVGDMKWHIGCSGFHYKEWKEVFYPAGLPQRKWFEFYSSRFDTLELNVTFYRFPQLKFLENWHTISPPGFSFSVKAPRLITHYKQFNECEQLLDDFYGTVQQGLKEKTGAILFQFPPKYDWNEKRLDLVIKNMRPGFNNVLEFRHPSWWDPVVFQKLREANIVFSGISHPTLPDNAIVNNRIAYYRFHGVPRLYYSEYDKQTLRRIAGSLLKDQELEEVFIYFNNTAGMGAIENAMWLKDLFIPEQMSEHQDQSR